MRLLATLLLATLLPAPALLAQVPADLDARIDREIPDLMARYRAFHASPELSKQERETSAAVAARLRELGYEVTHPFGTYDAPGATCYGVVAILRNGKGPTVLVRTDMDGLPITEQTGLPFASKVRAKNAAGEDVGVMHACGHDVHMTTFLGTARILSGMKDRWKGTLMLIGQPAEEVVAGAKGILAAGLYEKFGRPDYALALHDSALVGAGRIFYTPGFTMASSDSIDVTIRGIGSHGASPQTAKDPIVAASEFVLALQTIVSRERSPLDPVVLTVGSIHGGTKHNIIPDAVKLQLTLRTYKPEVRQRVLDSIARIAKGIAIAMGVPEDRMPLVEVVQAESTEATYNDPPLTRRLAAALQKTLGAANVVEHEPLMVAEDFGRFSLGGKIPSAMFHLGAVDQAKLDRGDRVPGLHSSEFAPAAEPAIRTGVKAMTTMVLELIGK